MSTFFLVLHLVTCLVLIFVVLIQSGKEGGIGAMGGGSSQTVFGSSGGANFFTKFTSGCAAVFMLTSIVLTVTKGGKRASIFDNAKTAPVIPSNTAPTAPNASAPAAQAIPPTTATQPDAKAAPKATH